MDNVAEVRVVFVVVVVVRVCNWSVHIQLAHEFALGLINNFVRDCSETDVGKVDLRDRID